MHHVRIPRPQVGEYAPVFHAEITSVPEAADFTTLLRIQADSTRCLADQFGEEGASIRYAPDKWTVREVVGHLADVERILSYRALRIARGDTTPLPSFDEKAYVPAGLFESRALCDVLAEFLTVREATISLIEGLPTGVVGRAGPVGRGTITVAALLYLIAGHERHHQELLRERYLPLHHAVAVA